MYRRVYIAGCGDTGGHVGLREVLRGREVVGLARSDAAARRLEETGIHPERGDLDDPASLAPTVDGDTLLYYFAPPPPRGREDTRLRAFLASLTGARCPARVVLISTSGVYGDCDGAWVDETRAPAPGSERAHRRLDAEQALTAWTREHDATSIVLRVSGIYSRARLPKSRIERGEPVLRAALSPYSNRIHLQDLIEVCLAAGELRNGPKLVNVADGHPTTMSDYFAQAADALGLPRPPEIDWDEARRTLSPGMLSYLAESRRLDNTRLREGLGVTLRYPTLATGLAAEVGEPLL